MIVLTVAGGFGGKVPPNIKRKSGILGCEVYIYTCGADVSAITSTTCLHLRAIGASGRSVHGLFNKCKTFGFFEKVFFFCLFFFLDVGRVCEPEY